MNNNMISEEQQKMNMERFESLLLSTGREGIDDLLKFIRKSDFYTAPASTRFHAAVKGGLCAHSLNVHDVLRQKNETMKFNKIKLWDEIPEDSLIITSLLHDLCKTFYYVETTKNVKHYEPEIVEEESKNGAVVKTDAAGRYVWVSERGYEVDDKIPYGHGEKSVMMIEKYIELKGFERYMIRWHMGFSVPKEDWPVFGHALEMYPWILALYEADMEASYMLDTRKK